MQTLNKELRELNEAMALTRPQKLLSEDEARTLMHQHGLTPDQLQAVGISESLAQFFASSVRMGLDKQGASIQNAVHDTTLKALSKWSGLEGGNLLDLIAEGRIEPTALQGAGLSAEDATLLSFWVKLFVVYPENVKDVFECINNLPHQAGVAVEHVDDPTLDEDIDEWLGVWLGVRDSIKGRLGWQELGQLEAIAKHEKQPLLLRLIKQIEFETTVEHWARNLTRYSILDGYSREDAEWISARAVGRREQRLYGNAYGFARRDFHALMMNSGQGYTGRCRCPSCIQAAIQKRTILSKIR